jgi:hypothetical protein
MSRQYQEIETVRDSDGVVAVITQRVGSNYFSFRILKEYVDQNDGEVKYTSFMGRRHLDAVERVTQQVRDRIDVLEDQFKVRRARQGYSVP